MKLVGGRTKLKEFKHEYIRSIFFAREDKKWEESDKHHIPLVDGIPCGALKEDSDEPWHLRKAYGGIWKDLDELEELTAETFQPFKKKLAKDFTGMCTIMMKYQKKSHKKIYEENLLKVLDPLIQLLTANQRLSFYEFKYDTAEKRAKTDFKQRSLVKQFCINFQKVLTILYEVESDPAKKTKANPLCERIFNKLNYENWEHNEIEKFYLTPLKTAFYQMRTHMCVLMRLGIDYWKQPISANTQLLADIK